MKKLLSIILSITMLFTMSTVVFAEEISSGTPAYVPTFEELTELSIEDIDHIVIRSGIDGIGYSTDDNKIISDIYNTINTKTFVPYESDGDGWSYEIAFVDKSNETFTYTMNIGIKSEWAVFYKTSNEEELKKVVENAYNLISDDSLKEKYTFEELTNISAENVNKVSITYNNGERIPAETSSPLIISNIINTFKDMEFIEDTREGSAGGWLYAINFYMDDETYIQFGTRLYIDKIDYKAVDYNSVTEKMTHYHDLIKSIDSSEWATDYILECMELGFLEDVSELNYKEPITREKFCEIVYNMLMKTADKGMAVPSAFYFEDTYNSKVSTLYYADIIKGKGERLFAPDDYLTREEAATILYRVAEFLEVDMPQTTYDESIPYYADKEAISDWAFNAVFVMKEMGIMVGTSETEFSPKETYTAEQAIATIIRMYNLCK